MAGNGGYGGGPRRGGNGGPQGGRGGGGPPPVPPKGEGGPVQAFRKMLYDSMKRIEGLFPQGGPQMAKRICAMALIHYERMLLEGQDPTIDSVFQAVMRLAQYGLELVADQAYLYSYGAKAEMVIGPGGLITLASRSGLMARAEVVFEGDEFDYQLGTDMHSPGGWVKHKKGDERRPANRKDTEKVVTHAYAFVLPRTIKQGEIPIPVIVVLTAEDIAYYRGFSRANKGPWFDNFEGMVRKTVLKRALKFAPVDMLLTWALTETETGGAVPFIDTFGETMDEDERAARAALTEGRQSAREQLGLDDQGREEEPAPQRQQAPQQRAQRAPEPASDGREPGPPPDGPPAQQGAFGEWAMGQGQR